MMLEAVDETVTMVRRISSELRPGILDDLGLAAAVEWQGREFQTRSGVSCIVNIPEEEGSGAKPGPSHRIFPNLSGNTHKCCAPLAGQ